MILYINFLFILYNNAVHDRVLVTSNNLVMNLVAVQSYYNRENNATLISYHKTTEYRSYQSKIMSKHTNLKSTV